MRRALAQRGQAEAGKVASGLLIANSWFRWDRWRKRERGGPANCMVSLLGAPGVEADAVVGVGDGTDDASVPLTGQAPLTGTPVVDPIESLQR